MLKIKYYISTVESMKIYSRYIINPPFSLYVKAASINTCSGEACEDLSSAAEGV